MNSITDIEKRDPRREHYTPPQYQSFYAGARVSGSDDGDDTPSGGGQTRYINPFSPALRTAL